MQAARQIRFTHAEEIAALETILKDYIYQAIQVEKSGQEVTFKKHTEFAVSEQFQRKLDEIV